MLSEVLLEAQKQGAIAKWTDSHVLACFVSLHSTASYCREWDAHFSAEPHKMLFNA
jgi:hypothetical protein